MDEMMFGCYLAALSAFGRLDLLLCLIRLMRTLEIRLPWLATHRNFVLIVDTTELEKAINWSTSGSSSLQSVCPLLFSALFDFSMS